MELWRLREIDKRLVEMHWITSPGEYGLGTEKKSIPNDEKKAWEKIEQLRDEIEQLLQPFRTKEYYDGV